MNKKNHWENVYKIRPTDTLGWYREHLETSLAWIKELDLPADAPIIDIGGGASSLVDDLIDAGHTSISVLDISDEALKLAKERLGTKSNQVTWLVGDITTHEFQLEYYELWHDRAVFHFLNTEEQQQKYIDNLAKGLKTEGHLIIGTFAPEAPAMCSGLPVQRYSVELLANTLGERFALQRHHKELHVTPGGVEQMYLYSYFLKTK